MQNFFLKNNKLGFTMIELMIATAIVVIMAATSIPVLNRFTTKSALDQTARKLQGNLALLQSKALSGSAYNGVPSYWGFVTCVGAGSNQYWLGHSIDSVDPIGVPDSFNTDVTENLTALTKFDGCSGHTDPIYFERFTGKLVAEDGTYLESVSLVVEHTENEARRKTILITSGGKIESY